MLRRPRRGRRCRRSPAEPGSRRAAPRARGRRRQPVHGVHGDSRPSRSAPGHRDPPRRPGAAPVLQGPGRAVRPGRRPRDRARLLRPNGRAPATAARTSTTWSTCSRRRRTGSAPTWPPRSRTCASSRRRALRRVSTVGFCFGGRISFNQAARGHGLDGVIGFYGGPQQRGRRRPQRPDDWRPRYACKVLGLFGGADQGIPPEAIEAFGAALDDAGVEHDLVTYEGAPHSFFDRTFADTKDACDDAWQRMLRFVGRSD